MGSVGTTQRTEQAWNNNNTRIETDFATWLDSKDRKAFTADRYNVFEKLNLDEVRKYLKPESETGFSYNDNDEVPEDNYWYIEYADGTTVYLEPGDSLKGVKRSNINIAINENSETTMVYSKAGSGYVEIYNDARFEENNDIWRWRRR